MEMRRCAYVAADGKQCLYDAYWVIIDCKRKHSVHAYACPPHLEPLMEPLSNDQLWWIRPAPPDPDD
jgi:hypothetical protein